MHRASNFGKHKLTPGFPKSGVPNVECNYSRILVTGMPKSGPLAHGSTHLKAPRQRGSALKGLAAEQGGAEEAHHATL